MVAVWGWVPCSVADKFESFESEVEVDCGVEAQAVSELKHLVAKVNILK